MNTGYISFLLLVKELELVNLKIMNSIFPRFGILVNQLTLSPQPFHQQLQRTGSRPGSSDSNGSTDALLNADSVWLMMGKEYRISRNIRMDWFFKHLHTNVSPKSQEEIVITILCLVVGGTLPFSLQSLYFCKAKY